MSIYPTTLKYTPLYNANELSGPRESLTVGTSNGTSFQMNQPFEITVPMNQPGYVCNFKKSYITVEINNISTVALKFQPRAGSLGLISQLQVKTSTGKEFSNFENFNVLAPLLIQRDVDQDWYNSTGNALFGCGLNEAATEGLAAPAAGATTTLVKALPIELTGVSYEQFPMDSIADLVFRMKLDIPNTAFVMATSVASNLVTISNIVLHYDVYKLSPSLINEIDTTLMDNSYLLDVKDWVHQQRSLSAATTKFTDEIGFSKKKAKRLIMVIRRTPDITDQTMQSTCSRTQAGLKNVTCYLNNRAYQSSSGIEMDSAHMVEAYAEMLKNDGGFFTMKPNSLSFAKFGDISSDDPISVATSGVFFHEISFENGMDVDLSSSGVQINHNNLKISVVKDASATDLTIDYFVEFDNQYIMNKQTRVWDIVDTGLLQS